jgi:hypothetical protein
VHEGRAAGGGSDIPVGVLQVQVNNGVWGIVAIEGNSQVNMQAALTAPSYVKADVVNRGKAVVGAVGDGGLMLGYSGRPDRGCRTGHPHEGRLSQTSSCIPVPVRSCSQRHAASGPGR